MPLEGCLGLPLPSPSDEAMSAGGKHLGKCLCGKEDVWQVGEGAICVD